ncbi:MAG: hypothetical protein WAW11_00420, partial [Patescibacteria group bacterium]
MEMPTRAYWQKLIISGNILEIYDYEDPIRLGTKRKKRKQGVNKKPKIPPSEIEAEHEEYKQEIKNNFSLRRTKSNIVRLINANPELKAFVTLTFDDKKSNDGSFTDINKCNLIFTNFIKRLKRHYPDLRYLAVPEFQSDYYYRSKIKKEYGGNIHYHVICNLPYVSNDQLSKIWNHGFVNINNIRHVSRIGLYVAKYIGKALFDGRLFGKKKVFSSRQLLKPKIIITGRKIRDYIN